MSVRVLGTEVVVTTQIVPTEIMTQEGDTDSVVVDIVAAKGAINMY